MAVNVTDKLRSLQLHTSELGNQASAKSDIEYSTLEIPGLTARLLYSDFIPSPVYNSLPPIHLQTIVPSTTLVRFGQIFIKYGLEHIFGAHLIYNRFWPGGIADGEFVATSKMPYSDAKKSHLGGVNKADRMSWGSAKSATSVGTSKSNSGTQGGLESSILKDNRGRPLTMKKVIWQCGLWELGLSPKQELVDPFAAPPPTNRSNSSTSSSTTSSAGSTNSSIRSPSICSADMNMVHGRLFFFNRNSDPPGFQPYEYQYGYINPLLPRMKIADAFFHELARFVQDHRLETVLGFELLDHEANEDGFKAAFCVEEFDPQRSRKAEIVEVPAAKELSWSFRRSLLQQGEVDVEAGLVRLN